jgi:hypothetical protein
MSAEYAQTVGSVLAAIKRIFEVEATYEYPGFISIPERFVSETTDDNRNAWAVGPDGDGCWTGQLMGPDGGLVGNMTFVVRPTTTDPDDIAEAVYTHGIGDWYIGGGCSDHDCPSKGVRR